MLRRFRRITYRSLYEIVSPSMPAQVVLYTGRQNAHGGSGNEGKGKDELPGRDESGEEGRRHLLRRGGGADRAALDACDVCFRTNRGYRQEGDQMVCNNCGQKFACDKVGEVKGGCNPHPRAHKEAAGGMVIRKVDIVAWQGNFGGA